MKLHPILGQRFILWWFLLATAIVLKLIIFGYAEDGLSSTQTYEDAGFMTWIFGLFLCGLVFALPFYLLYRVFWKKWNPKVYMILISIFVLLSLLLV